MNIATSDLALIAECIGKTSDELLQALADFREGQYERLKEFGVRVRNSTAKPSVVCDYRKQSFRVRQDDSLGIVREMLKIYTPVALPSAGKFESVFELAAVRKEADAATVAICGKQGRTESLTATRQAVAKLLQLVSAYGPEGVVALDIVAASMGAGVEPKLWAEIKEKIANGA